MSDVATVSLDGRIDSYRAAMAEAAKIGRETFREIAASNQPVQAAAARTGEAHTGLLGVMKEFRKEQVQQGRMARFYAAELASVIPAGDGAKGTIQGLLGVLIEGAAGGMSFALAFEAVKFGIELVGRAYNEASKAAKEAEERFKASIDSVRAATASAMDGIQKAIERASLAKPSDTLQRQAEAAEEVARRHGQRMAEALADASRPREGETVRAWAKRREETAEELRLLQDNADRWAAHARAKREEASTVGSVEAIEDSRELSKKLADLQIEAAEGEQQILLRAEKEKKEIREKYGASNPSLVAKVATRIDAKAAKDVEELQKRESDRAIDEAVRESQRVNEIRARWTQVGQDEISKLTERANKDLAALDENEVEARKEVWAGFYRELVRLDKETSDRRQQQQAAVLADMARKVERYTAPLTRAFDSVVDGLLQGSLDLTSILKTMFADTIKMLIGMLVEMGIQKIASSLLGAGAAKTAAISETHGNIAVASTGAAAALAGIPIVGPALAAAAAASMEASLMAMSEPLLAAAGGFDVPSFVDPVVQLHRKEMVLPAPIADPLREALAENRLGSRGYTINLTIQALDGASVERVLMANDGAVARALHRLARNRRA